MLRCKDAATYLGLSYGTFRNLLSQGRGPAASVTYGKRDRSFTIAQLDAYIATRTIQSQPTMLEAEKVKRRRGRPRKTEAEKHKHLTHWVAIMIALYIAYLFWIYGIFNVAIGSTLSS
ncbi:helix-turn-helix domain-containing protein [Acidomonas methanolica]|uniref:helix-turn-helix domain-containing protein n=1 Tax=Acidomonas methanolica TaxID=437 RepID=UPI000698D08D|nr:helix-turn-helix domain-containing protein [Acidomonas methanolica]